MKDDHFHKLCEACRSGDVEQVDYLISGNLADPNQIDDFDATPLILASLCGHVEVVSYLLSHGAKMDRDTFQAERCLYGALNNEIKQILLSYDVSKRVDLNQPFVAHLTSIRNLYTDVRFTHGEQSIAAHKYILSLRSPYFRDKFLHKWNSKNDIPLKDSNSFETFQRILSFIYLEDASLNTDYHKYLRKFDITLLQNPTLEIAQAQRQFLEFAQTAIIENSNDDQAPAAHPDCLLDVYGKIYPAHKTMLIKSDFFKVMFASPMYESQQGMPTIPLFVSLEIAETVIVAFYSDTIVVDPDVAIEILYAADMLLLDRLKRACAISISNCHDDPPGSIYDILRAAWACHVERLEQYAAEYMAHHFEEIILEEEFAQIIKESACKIKARQETDSIEVVDDMRYYLSQRFGIIKETIEKNTGKVAQDLYLGFSDSEEQYNLCLEKLELLLISLDLEA